ncbi:pyruvate kinase [Halopseudomonas xinjiangensis]|uniref:Pyruvate kinase n=1 Tax=Halopseudomonas xinjiangensis TaxID=487184 RepID=A0A1H1N3T9_9GAMM|nr:pyruvate kinase [Halopseudomonas xinjiangensis]SDR93395.1 pyruvate kinase [Halopseudomonas xinjiangensis]
MTLRRTKIVATLGPASTSPECIAALIDAGMDVARMNFSHGTPDEHRERARLVRELAADRGRHVALLGDLQGPKIRIARFSEGKTQLEVGDHFRLSTSHPLDEGNHDVVGIDYPQLVEDCRAGDELLLDDGRIVLRVDSVGRDEVRCTVTAGGTLSNHKGINRRGGGLSAAALTDKDRADIVLAAELNMEYVAVSFPRDASDMHLARKLLADSESQAWLIAKIERAEAVADQAALDGLIEASDGVMVARGDLGVEIGDAELVGIQKLIISRARAQNKVVITATQMMESMISSPLPTRAEVSDVANAALDYTDAVMLSAESAAGKYPIEAVQAMARVCIGAEKHPTSQQSGHRLHEKFERCDETVALAAMYAGNHFPGVTAVITLTETGHTPLIMSRIRSPLPIFALSPNAQTLGKVAMMRGVQSIFFNPAELNSSDVNHEAVNRLLQLGHVKAGDWVILTKGDVYNSRGGTNSMKLLHVGERLV